MSDCIITKTEYTTLTFCHAQRGGAATKVLTNREKGIVHYLCVMIVTILDGKRRELFLETFGRLQKARARSLSDAEIKEIVYDLNEEFLLSDIFIKSNRPGNYTGDESLV